MSFWCFRFLSVWWAVRSSYRANSVTPPHITGSRTLTHTHNIHIAQEPICTQIRLRAFHKHFELLQFTSVLSNVVAVLLWAKKTNNLRISFAWFVWNFENYADIWLLFSFRLASRSWQYLSWKFIWIAVVLNIFFIQKWLYKYSNYHKHGDNLHIQNTYTHTHTHKHSQETNWNGISCIFSIFLGSLTQTLKPLLYSICFHYSKLSKSIETCWCFCFFFSVFVCCERNKKKKVFLATITKSILNSFLLFI